MKDQIEIEKIQQAILALEAQRQSLGDEVVKTAVAPLRAKLASLGAENLYEQRKLATVLFTDLVGSTALSTQLDPEDMHALLNAYFDRCRQIIEQHGGIVEKFIGDAVMAVFGMVISREDDPERATYAGLEITRLVEQLQLPPALSPGYSLATRVGITTGEVVIGALGERSEDEIVAIGDAVNLASRLQNAAPPNGVLITHDTYRHLGGVFEVQPLGALNLKGFPNPVQAYLVKAARPRAFRLIRRGIEGIDTPLVGREMELNRLRQAFEQVLQDGQQQVLIVMGEAGIGKSRLIAEFEDWLELLPQDIFYFKGRAHPSMQTAPYSLFRDIFAFRFHIQDSDPPPTVRLKLEQGYAQAFSSISPGRESEAESRSTERAAHFLGRLLGFEFGPSEHLPSVTQDARLLYDQTFVYLRDFFAALGREHPVVILLEELHWADDSSLHLLHELANSLSEVPILLVAAARPSLFERHPHWGVDLPTYHLLELGPLSAKDSLALIERILHKVEDLPTSLSDLVVGTAEGNPFYIEELLKMLIEDGIILTQASRWHIEGERLAEIRVPPTLTGVLQARFDSLTAQERIYLQRGSVIGRVFWDKAIEYLGQEIDIAFEHPDSLSPELPDRLCARAMIFEREVSTFEDTREYSFKHALLRDVTYESLLKRQRRIFHRQAARWLEQVTEHSGRTDEFTTLIADHYEHAGELALAARLYGRAGETAASRYAHAEAIHAFNRSLELISPDDLARQFEIHLSLEKVYDLQGSKEQQLHELDDLHEIAHKLVDPARQARVALRRAAYELSISDFPAAIASAHQASTLAQAAQVMDIIAESDLLQASALIRQGTLEEAQEHARDALDQAHQHGMHQVEANSLRILGLIAYYMGSHKEARDRFSAALDLYVEIGDRQGEGMALNNLGGATFDLGDPALAKDYYSRSLELCQEIGDRIGEARAFNNLGITAVVQNEYTVAEDYYLKGLQIARQLGNRSFELSALDNLGNLALYRYHFSQAMRYQQQALLGAREIGDRVSEGFVLGNWAHSSLMVGDYVSARDFIQKGLEIIRGVGDQQGECNLLISLSRVDCEAGNPESALSHAKQALKLAGELDLKSEEGSALHRLGEAALILGRTQAAVEYYQSALRVRRQLQETEACDSWAGLARAYLTLGDLFHAMVQVKELLQSWQAKGMLGLDQPVSDLLTCYQVLSATQDPRAFDLLERAYHFLQESAANIDDESQRLAFLQNVPANRELIRTWDAARR